MLNYSQYTTVVNKAECTKQTKISLFLCFEFRSFKKILSIQYYNKNIIKCEKTPFYWTFSKLTIHHIEFRINFNHTFLAKTLNLGFEVRIKYKIVFQNAFQLGSNRLQGFTEDLNKRFSVKLTYCPNYKSLSFVTDYCAIRNEK